MKRKLFFMILWFSVAKVLAQDTPTDIFLFLGQSNMAGVSAIGNLDTVTLQNVYLFNDQEKWEKAKNTLTQGTNRYSSVRSVTNRLSPAYTFTRKLAAYTGQKIGIVSNARGATTISWWQKGYEGENDYDLYEGAIARAQAALTATPGAKIKGIIWHQGEGDNSSASSKLYMERLQQLVSDLRTDLGDNTIPFIAGEVGKWNGRGLGVNPVIRSIKQHIPYTDWVSSDGLESLDVVNNDAHFDTFSQRVLGGRYADKALELIYQSKLKGVTVFSSNNYTGRSVLLGEGDYNNTELESMGVLMNEIASLRTDIGYEIQLFSGNIDESSFVTIFDNTTVLSDIVVSSIRVKKRTQGVFAGWENQGSSYLYNFSGARGAGQPSSLGPNPSGYSNSSTVAAPGWLPAPTSGTAYIRYSGAVQFNGGYELLPAENPDRVQVRITNGGPTKLSLIDAGGATEITRFAMNLKFGDKGANGLIRMALGNTNGIGASGVFTSSSNVASGAVQADVFAVLTFQYSAAGITLNARRNKTGSSTGTTDVSYSEIKANVFSLDGSYELEVFMNNSAVEQAYKYGTENIIIPSRAYHIWIEGMQFGVSGAVNFPAAVDGVPELGINKPINAFGISHLSGHATNPEATVTLSNIRFDYAASTLPVSLASFTAQKQNNEVKLNWTTLSEHNNSHFDVLRSSDGKIFSSITQVSGAGNSTEIHKYSYTDYQPFSGINYYKLKQVDFDGATAESEIQSVIMDLKESGLVVIKGENGKVYASVYADISGEGSIRLSDVSGRKLYESKVPLNAGYNQIELPVSSLPETLYIVSLTGNGTIQSVKFLNSAMLTP